MNRCEAGDGVVVRQAAHADVGHVQKLGESAGCSLRQLSRVHGGELCADLVDGGVGALQGQLAVVQPRGEPRQHLRDEHADQTDEQGGGSRLQQVVGPAEATDGM